MSDTPDLSLNEIYSQFFFIFVSSGIIMSIVVGIGIIGNILTLVILCQKSLRSAPVCLLQCLTVHAIVNMVYAIYSDIEPAIRSYVVAQNLLDVLNFPKMDLRDFCDFEIVPNKSNAMPGIELSTPKQSHSESAMINGTRDCQDALASSELESLIISALFSINNITNLNLSNVSQNLSFPGYLHSRNSSSFAKGSVTISSYIRKSFERFFAYTIVYFGLLITLCLAMERCIAVSFPLKAVRIITMRRTRTAIFVIAAFCCIVHMPQLCQDIANADRITPEVSDTLLTFWRKDYERFYTISSLILCIMLFVINVIILRKLVVLKSRYAPFKHTKNAQYAEANVTMIIVLLIFCQLPLYIFINIVAFMSKENYFRNFLLMTKLMTIIRLFYISQSALNFVVYCVFARKFRQVIKDTCDSLATSAVIGNNKTNADDIQLKPFCRKLQLDRKESDCVTCVNLNGSNRSDINIS